MHKNKGGGAAWKARASLAGGLAAPTIVPTPEDLATHVAQLMNQATEGTETGLSEQLVAVEIEAPTLPDLTLIDLPGIVRTRIAGQGAGTLAAINRMVDAYLSQPATIVLAVVPANQDIATQEVLERAAAADPEGLRTLAVLTKPDLVGLGNEDEVAEVCSNRRKPLKLGYVMVKNNADPAGGADHDAEERYFREHPVFSKIDRKLLGFRNLTVKLTALFAEHIKHFLPHIKFQLQRPGDGRRPRWRRWARPARLGGRWPPRRSSGELVRQGAGAPPRPAWRSTSRRSSWATTACASAPRATTSSPSCAPRWRAGRRPSARPSSRRTCGARWRACAAASCPASSAASSSTGSWPTRWRSGGRTWTGRGCSCRARWRRWWACCAASRPATTRAWWKRWTSSCTRPSASWRTRSSRRWTRH
ncbi:unnamed protein product [Heterosigma akashiwo]